MSPKHRHEHFEKLLNSLKPEPIDCLLLKAVAVLNLKDKNTSFPAFPAFFVAKKEAAGTTNSIIAHVRRCT